MTTRRNYVVNPEYFNQKLNENELENEEKFRRRGRSEGSLLDHLRSFYYQSHSTSDHDSGGLYNHKNETQAGRRFSSFQLALFTTLMLMVAMALIHWLLIGTYQYANNARVVLMSEPQNTQADQLIISNANSAQNKLKWISPDNLNHQRMEGVAYQSQNVPNITFLLNSNVPILALCHPHWHGIRQATYGYGFPVLEVDGIYTQKHVNTLILMMEHMVSLKKLVVNGIPDGTLQLARAIKNNPLLNGRIEVLWVYHGSLAQPFHGEEAPAVDRMIQYAKVHIVDRVAVVKQGLRLTFESMIGRIGSVYELWNFPSAPIELRNVKQLDKTPGQYQSQVYYDVAGDEATNVKQFAQTYNNQVQYTHKKSWNIGVFGSFWVHKNVLVQIASLCQFGTDVVIHVLRLPQNIQYLRQCGARIVQHGEFLQHDTFMVLLQRMDMTLYISLTECFPMAVVESISVGIPALTSATSPVYELDPWLFQMLVVSELDSPDAIGRQVRQVMDNYEDVVRRLWRLVPLIDNRATLLLDRFINNQTGATEGKYKMSTESADASPLQMSRLAVSVTIAFVWLADLPEHYAVIQNCVVKNELAKGNDIVLLTNQSRARVEAYIAHLKLPQSGKLYVYRLLDDDVLSQRLATVYQETLFDILEVPDYLGLAYNLLSPGWRNQLPAKVLVFVRVYGSYQIKQQYNKYNFGESALKSQIAELQRQKNNIYMKEQYSLLTADAVLCPSLWCKLVMTKAYGVESVHIMVDSHQQIMPSLNEYLQQEMVMFGREVGSTVGSARALKFIYIDIAKQSSRGVIHQVGQILSFLETFAVTWPEVRFVFAAEQNFTESVQDFQLLSVASLLAKVKATGKQPSISVLMLAPVLKQVKELIPKALLKYFLFGFAPQDWQQLSVVASSLHCAIYTDYHDFNALDMIALHQLRVPLMISNTSKFRELFAQYAHTADNMVYYYQAQDDAIDSVTGMSTEWQVADYDQDGVESTEKPYRWRSNSLDPKLDLKLAIGASFRNALVKILKQEPHNPRSYAAAFKDSEPLEHQSQQQFQPVYQKYAIPTHRRMLDNARADLIRKFIQKSD